MKKRTLVLFCLILLILSSCGSIVVTTAGCKTDARFGSTVSEDGRIESVEKNLSQISTKKTTLLFDENVSIKEMTEKNSMNCSTLKNVQLEMKETFGLFNEIQLRF